LYIIICVGVIVGVVVVFVVSIVVGVVVGIIVVIVGNIVVVIVGVIVVGVVVGVVAVIVVVVVIVGVIVVGVVVGVVADVVVGVVVVVSVIFCGFIRADFELTARPIIISKYTSQTWTTSFAASPLQAITLRMAGLAIIFYPIHLFELALRIIIIEKNTSQGRTAFGGPPFTTALNPFSWTSLKKNEKETNNCEDEKKIHESFI